MVISMRNQCLKFLNTIEIAANYLEILKKKNHDHSTYIRVKKLTFRTPLQLPLKK